jgi:hypothetical protein
MSTNCYSKKGRIPREKMTEQTERLTSKHIETLSFLQDIVAENKELKAKNEELEVQFDLYTVKSGFIGINHIGYIGLYSGFCM